MTININIDIIRNFLLKIKVMQINVWLTQEINKIIYQWTNLKMALVAHCWREFSKLHLCSVYAMLFLVEHRYSELILLIRFKLRWD